MIVADFRVKIHSTFLGYYIMIMQGGSLDLAEKADAGYHTTFIIGFELG